MYHLNIPSKRAWRVWNSANDLEFASGTTGPTSRRNVAAGDRATSTARQHGSASGRRRASPAGPWRCAVRASRASSWCWSTVSWITRPHPVVNSPRCRRRLGTSVARRCSRPPRRRDSLWDARTTDRSGSHPRRAGRQPPQDRGRRRCSPSTEVAARPWSQPAAATRACNAATRADSVPIRRDATSSARCARSHARASASAAQPDAHRPLDALVVVGGRTVRRWRDSSPPRQPPDSRPRARDARRRQRPRSACRRRAAPGPDYLVASFNRTLARVENLTSSLESRVRRATLDPRRATASCAEANAHLRAASSRAARSGRRFSPDARRGRGDAFAHGARHTLNRSSAAADAARAGLGAGNDAKLGSSKSQVRRMIEIMRNLLDRTADSGARRNMVAVPARWSATRSRSSKTVESAGVDLVWHVDDDDAAAASGDPVALLADARGSARQHGGRTVAVRDDPRERLGRRRRRCRPRCRDRRRRRRSRHRARPRRACSSPSSPSPRTTAPATSPRGRAARGARSRHGRRRRARAEPLTMRPSLEHPADTVWSSTTTDGLPETAKPVLGETDPRARCRACARSRSTWSSPTSHAAARRAGAARAPARRSADLPVIVATAFGSIDTAVHRDRSAGAIDYVSKPMDVDEVRADVRRALDRRREKERVAVPASGGLDDVVGRSPAMVSRCTARSRASSRRPRRRSWCSARAARKGAHRAGGPTATKARVAPDASSPWTAPRSATRCSRASSSATCAAPSPARSARRPGLFVEGGRRTIFPRRDRRRLARDATRLLRDAAKAPGTTGGRHALDAGRRAHRRGDAPRPRRRGSRRDLPPGPYRLQVVTVALPALRERRERTFRCSSTGCCRGRRRRPANRCAASRTRRSSCSRARMAGQRARARGIERAVVLARHDVLAAEDFPMLTERAASHGGVAAHAAASADEPRSDAPEELKRRCS